jgi:hypothetical protein
VQELVVVVAVDVGQLAKDLLQLGVLSLQKGVSSHGLG